MEVSPTNNASASNGALPAADPHTHTTAHLHFAFPKFKHEQHGPIIDVNKVTDENITLGARIADAVTACMGSWSFIIIQSIILALWIIFNVITIINVWESPNHWDPYPFILLNLALSFQAAFAGPFVMMSQNRQAAKDRLMAENDYKTDVKGEQEIAHIMEHLDHQDALILQIVQRLEGQNKVIEQEEEQTLSIVEQLKAQNDLLNKQDAMILQIVQRMETQHQQISEQREELFKRINDLVTTSTPAPTSSATKSTTTRKGRQTTKGTNPQS
jgi:uncharacterized membrane protein